MRSELHTPLLSFPISLRIHLSDWSFVASAFGWSSFAVRYVKPDNEIARFLWLRLWRFSVPVVVSTTAGVFLFSCLALLLYVPEHVVVKVDRSCPSTYNHNMTKRKNAAAVALSRLGAKKGGDARAAKLTPTQRSESARRAVQARWAKAKEGSDYIVVRKMNTKKFTQTSDKSAILQRIDAIVSDNDQYQENETRPSTEIVDLAKKLIRAAENAGVTRFPKTYISPQRSP